MKSKILTILIWIISLTWGFPMTLVGLFAILILSIRGKRFKKFGPIICFPITDGWGLNLGVVAIVPKDFNFNTNCHEFGHCLQACLFGPIMPFVIAIPSVVRFWFRKQKSYDDKDDFLTVLHLLCIVVGCVIGIIGSIFQFVWAIVLGLFTIIYSFVINRLWLRETELVKYKNGQTPSYYDVWFERDATNYGKKCIKKYYPKEDKKQW